MKSEHYRISVPWVLERLGVRQWLRSRVLHMPERYIGGWCELLTRAGVPMTPEQWRTVEQRVADLVYDGVLLRVEQ